MRFAVEYQGVGGRVGLIIFSAYNQQAAQVYVDELKTRGHERVWNLNELTEGKGPENRRWWQTPML